MTEERSTVDAGQVKSFVRNPRIPIRFTALPSGTRLRQYIVQEAIGAGGFGITYRAEHVTLRDKSFALKEFFPRDFAYREGMAVHPTQGGEDLCDFGRERFLQEAKILARCEHPAIVDVVDYFEANSTAYAALEYVPGLPLAQWLDQLGRRPTQAELDSIVEPLLDALDVVHSHRLLHRDIAPDNILIRPNGMPCLIDFGAARSDMGQKAERTAMIVKHGYSPPEQHMGDAEKQGRWTDIYALGATLYRSLMGVPPPGAMQRVANRGPMPPMPAAMYEEYRPGFLRAIEMALQIDIERRPQSIPQLREMLLASRGQTVRPTATASLAVDASSPEAVAKPHFVPAETGNEAAVTEIALAPHRRSRSWAATLAAISIAGGLAAAWALEPFGIWTRTAPPAPPAPAPGPTVSVSSQEPPGASPSSSSSAETSVPTPTIASSDTGGAQSSEPPTEQRPQASTPAQTVASTPVLSSQSSSSEAAAPPAEAPATASSAPISAPAPEPALPPLPPAVQTTALPPAPDGELVRLQSSCRNETGNAKLSACMALLLAVPLSDAQARYQAQVELGRAHRLRRDPDEAIKAYDEAIRQLPREAEAYNQRGIAKIDKRDLQGALTDFGAAVERNAEHGEALNNRAWVQLRLERPSEGLADADAAVRLLPDRPFVWNTRGQIHRRLGNRDNATRDFSEALRLDPNHRSSQQALNELRAGR